ncbi:hypothetical protein SLEP1_g42821 [Rubroshorea leprosula]|uniref:Uncharacterized protein n=1 Tax=Rubroshorea leprosula TaxID=152421 RepID=A0AAV5LB10_9ROSI|nr:hypothetical protein SLEP1_g42821 [Rubroshorea leprosula]
MGNAQILALYITISVITFVLSKIIDSVLIYKRWKRKQIVFAEGFVEDIEIKQQRHYRFGGYATVYRLTIDDSAAYAVKRLNRGSADRDRGFERELDAMGDKTPKHCDSSWILHSFSL